MSISIYLIKYQDFREHFSWSKNKSNKKGQDCSGKEKFKKSRIKNKKDWRGFKVQSMC